MGLTAICLGFLLITLDATVVNVALGHIVGDLGGSLSSAQWTVNGYTLSFAALLLSAGALADRVGARRGYAIGLVIFAAGSAGASAAPSLAVLIAARLVQGAGAAWLMPCSLALIAHMFPDTRPRRRALAIWAGCSGIGLTSGPIIGGVLTDCIGWRAIFLVNLPVAVIAIGMLLRTVSETKRHHHPLDAVGQCLAVATLTLVTGGLITAGQHGWSDLLALALLTTGVTAAAAFLLSQRRVAHPMVDRVLFERPDFARSITIGLIFNFCLYGSLFCLSIILTDGHYLSALGTGVALLPMTVVVGITAFGSGHVVARFNEWRAIAAGMTAGLAGAILVALNPAHGPTGLLVLSTLPLGLVALAMAAMTATAMAGTPPARVGLASGVLNTARQAGGALGVSALGALLHHSGVLSLHLAFSAVAVAYGVGLLIALQALRAKH